MIKIYYTVSSASSKYVVTSIMIEITFLILNTRLMWVMKLLVQTYLDIKGGFARRLAITVDKQNAILWYGQPSQYYNSV